MIRTRIHQTSTPGCLPLAYLCLATSVIVACVHCAGVEPTKSWGLAPSTTKDYSSAKGPVQALVHNRGPLVPETLASRAGLEPAPTNYLWPLYLLSSILTVPTTLDIGTR